MKNTNIKNHGVSEGGVRNADGGVGTWKHQAPTSRHQRSSNIQAPIRRGLEIGAWLFSGAWGLVFGASPAAFARNLRLGTAALLLATAGCTLRQAYPQTEIRGYINGQPFSVRAPKDANLTGFDAVAGTNGQVHVHIDSLQASLNATNLANAGNAQAAIVTATGAAINQAIQTAASTALKAAQ